MSKPERNQPRQPLSWSLPLILLLVLAILIVLQAFLKELRQPPAAPEIPVPSTRQPGRLSKMILPFSRQSAALAIIIDDLGWSVNLAKELAQIKQPLTLAILPFSPQAAVVAHILRKEKNKELLLHLPLEAAGPKVCRDGGLLKVEMSPEEIREQFEKDLKMLGEPVEGVNNHMGSLFTTDEEKMKVLLEVIKGHGLYFVDSLTAANSCGYRLAKDMGIPCGRRDVFLDNSSNPEDIREQLRLAADLARKNGRAIAIGHARKDTLQVLKEELPFLEQQGVKLVVVSSVLQ
ncbi:MAG TPA: divergent polysaccharide deacetylase family protein [bacterium]|nr:divergent polysaccharide deacetylase family protein [bacterium]HPP13242.1 divergent polysaccharide deacetylase family protein [bacterium]